MSGDEPSAVELPAVQPQHYQVLCGMALATIFLVLLQQTLVLFGLVALLMGAAAILLRARLSPILILLPVVGGQLLRQYLYPEWRLHTALDVEDVLLCAATLAYLAGHYRLLALWSNILPPDPRQRYHKGAHAVVPIARLGKVAPQHRPASHVSRGELAWFVLQLPLFALLAQGVWIVIGARRELHDLSPRWMQFLQLAWGLALGAFVAAQFFRIWRLLSIDRMTAQMLLQDELWNETRGEQRRIGRWLAWFNLRRRT
ncbi:MAG TPA: hypothetical protein VK898_18790 [Chloroflexota bacterium]|nr:hypothetical protein [Chloroflexota bacterium]